jgi:hypothetical protein
MPNVLRFPVAARRRTPPDPLSALAGLAARVAEIGHMKFETKDDMQQAILLLGLSNARARQLIGLISDSETRTRLLAHSDRIGELVEIAGRKAERI